MNANRERRWIESEARYDDARKPKRGVPASSRADDPNGAISNDDVRSQEGNLTAAVEEAVASNRGNGPVSGAAIEHLKDDLLDDSDDDEHDDASGWTDLFSDPDPMDEFHFRFELPIDHASDGDDISAAQDESNRSIDIHLVGYKAELGQTLHSTGLTLWRASSLLCDFLLQHPGYVRGKSVVEVRFETMQRDSGYTWTVHGVSGIVSHRCSLARSPQLGAGLGLCGILASHLRASKVVLTDGDSDALHYLRANVEKNVPQPQKRVENDIIDGTQAAAPAFVRQLVWGEAASFLTTDSERFDTVIGSDIIYVEEILEPLWRTVDDLVTPAGAFLLAFARRNVPIDRVFETASTHGFAWTCDDSNSEGVIEFRRAERR
jgi:predicted nicotinamide N-methyase